MRSKTAVLATVGIFVLAVTVMTINRRTSTAAGTEPSNDTEVLAELQELRIRLHAIDAEISRLSLYDPPVGSVFGFLGPIPKEENERRRWEAATGWLVCDGRPLAGNPAYEELRKTLGQENLPDLRGQFLRGADFHCSGALAGKDEDGIRTVGTGQECSTALPKSRPGVETRFLTAEQPGHDPTSTGTNRWGKVRHFNCLLAKCDGTAGLGDTIVGPADITKGEPELYRCAEIKSVPAHSHFITGGGNAETRPTNVAVYWIIKATSRKLSAPKK